MFWIVEKLQKRIEELAAYRYRHALALDEWEMQEDEAGANGVHRPPEIAGELRMRKGDRWVGYDRYVWLRRTVRVPEEWQGREVVGLFDFGLTGSGNNSAFESLLYLNGRPFQGVDTNHQEVFLPAELAGSEIELVFRLWSGLEGGGGPRDLEHQFKRAELAVLDAAADDLYFTGRAALETAKILEESNTSKHDLLTAADRAFLLVDWSRPGSDDFYASVGLAAEALRTAVSELDKNHPVTVRAIGHTHIDVAWLWQLKHTREKSARSFSTVLRLMEKYPEYVFLQTQPQLYAYIKKDYPEIYEQIRERVKEGRWEAGGAMWLEADCNLTSGESLVRQILHGTRFFRDEFGVECDYLWLPDVFGYSWALPQILRKSGIKTFMTTKISWSQYNRMPHDTFKWRGIDGSEVLTHFITTPELADPNVWWYTYNGQIEPFTVKGIWDTYRDKDINRELLLSYGYGDGGGGVNRHMLEMRRRLDEMPGLPKIVPGRAGDFFRKLHETVDATDRYVHTWDGELYLEYHRGTYTSQAYNKRMNRKLELMYREAEWLHSLSAVVGGGDWTAYPKEQLHEGWTTILRNQFHDIIPGSSIGAVYEDARSEYAEAERLGKEAIQAAAERLAGQADDPVVSVYNGAAFDRTELVGIPLSEGIGTKGAWLSDDGRPLRAEYNGSEWLVLAENVPATGAATLRFDPSAEPLAAAKAFEWEGGVLRTPHYELAFDGAGRLVRLYDRGLSREVLPRGARANELQVFEDKPKMFEAWDIDLFYQEKQREVTDLRKLDLVECGALSAVLRFEWAYGDSVIEQRLTVYAHDRRIDFATRANWRERQQLLKVAFPVEVRATEATYDIQFGNVKRPTHWNTSWDHARFETVGHQWVDLSERGYGVSLLNDCKYGHDIKDNVIRLSLIKSAIDPDPNADQGEHLFTYSLYPHAGDWAAGGTATAAWALNNPLLTIPGASAFAGKSLLRADGEHIAFDAIKKAEDEDALIVRLHEYAGGRGVATLTLGCKIASWQECDLLERPIGERHDGAEPLQFALAPYEIKTFMIRLCD
ncbi:alpha-mannosidase [Cohnella sp. OV330]|uniref:alpha-mannosidase n=1 Tax=Cohnella sp. OV330 TaxID=1855288 RepID=UPI0008DEDCB6|nr:alpha-mannosidase [Cohnella sp. OV330]SFB07520.1 alpha-mannosidase [Cohnella sp. OV330]